MSAGGLSERELKWLLAEVPVPVDPEAEERGLRMALAAHAERGLDRTEAEREGGPGRRPNPLPRIALAFAAAVLLGAFLLTPAWATVRDWVGEVFEPAPPPPAAHAGLDAIPGGGRLLVQSQGGSWVVNADGSRHLLGGYEEASWSPHGLFLAAAAGRRLSAVEPGGEVHWTLTAPGTVRDPRWSPSRELVAYRAGAGLRVVAGDGSEDRPLDESVAPLAPTWSPPGTTDLAYVDARGTLRVVDAGNGRALVRERALPGVREIEWSARGGELLEASPRRLRLRRVAIGRGGARVALAPPRTLPVPDGRKIVDAAISSGGPVAAILGRRNAAGAPRSEVVLYGAGAGSPQRLMSVPGRLTQLAWSPNGGRLLVAWPEADEWLFLRAGGGGRAISGVGSAFAEARGAFPTVTGWCCRIRPSR